MTSSPVNVSSFFSGMTAQTKGMEQTKKGGDFSEIFQTVKDTEPVQKAEDVATESVERDTVQTDNATENQKVDTTKAADEAKDVADTKTDEVKDTDDAAEVTGAEEISEETYEQIMELLSSGNFGGSTSVTYDAETEALRISNTLYDEQTETLTIGG